MATEKKYQLHVELPLRLGLNFDETCNFRGAKTAVITKLLEIWLKDIEQGKINRDRFLYEN